MINASFRINLARAVVLCQCCVLTIHATAAKPPETQTPRLTLPPEFQAVVGLPMHVYFDNVVLTRTPEAYRFTVSCDVGETGPRCWTVTPTQQDVGTHPWRITVTGADGQTRGRATMRLRVIPANAGAGRKVRLLVVGDSLTHATTYVNRLARLLSAPGNPCWTMLGTHKPSRAIHGVAHEGYGGWTWQRFAEHFEPHPDLKKRKRSSPFVFLDPMGKPRLDVKRYIDQYCQGDPPDFAIFLLGINDCFSAKADDPTAIDARIDAVFQQADKLLTAFREAAPDVSIGICLTTAPNSREEAFEANYDGRYPRWGWKRIQHRLVQREIKKFGHRENEKVFVIPTELNIDPIDGYPVNNGVHPNQHGYEQIGTTIHAWLKAQCAEQ